MPVPLSQMIGSSVPSGGGSGSGGGSSSGGSGGGGGGGGSGGSGSSGGSGGGGGGGGSDGNSAYYKKLLANDPQLQAALAAIAAQRAAYQGQMTAAEQQALEMYGQIPAGLASQYAALVTPTVQGLAAQATSGGVSTVAQLAKAYAQQQQGDLDNLAARGILRSGATGVHENADLQAHNVAGFNALQSLLSGLAGNYNTFLGQQDSLNQQASSATSDALNRIIQEIVGGVISGPGGGGGSGSSGGGGSGTPGITATGTITPLGSGSATAAPTGAPSAGGGVYRPAYQALPGATRTFYSHFGSLTPATSAVGL